MRAPLPNYALYGEPGGDLGPDRLHCETVAERSGRHDWEIRPHRHEALFQILYLRAGGVAAFVDGTTHALAAPLVLTVPALAPHGFRFDAGVDGVVVSVLEAHLRALLAGQPGLLERLRAQPLVVPLGARTAEHGALDAVLQRLAAEFAALAPWRALALDATLLQALVLLGRLAPDTTAQDAVGERALAHVRRFRELVEARFRTQPTLAALAGELGITPTQLNRVCRRVLGQPALAVLHRRLLLEAQRDLAYTTLSVKQIALGLGFADAGYFTRFFRRGAGLTPTGWRERAR